MIDVKRAIANAKQFLEDIYGRGVMQIESPFQLEEVEKSDDGRYWYVTFSFMKKDISPLATDMLVRQYKIVKVDSETGESLSIKMREFV